MKLRFLILIGIFACGLLTSCEQTETVNIKTNVKTFFKCSNDIDDCTLNMTVIDSVNTVDSTQSGVYMTVVTTNLICDSLQSQSMVLAYHMNTSASSGHSHSYSESPNVVIKAGESHTYVHKFDGAVYDCDHKAFANFGLLNPATGESTSLTQGIE